MKGITLASKGYITKGLVEINQLSCNLGIEVEVGIGIEVEVENELHIDVRVCQSA